MEDSALSGRACQRALFYMGRRAAKYNQENTIPKLVLDRRGIRRDQGHARSNIQQQSQANCKNISEI
jgi:hypothetical protein